MTKHTGFFKNTILGWKVNIMKENVKHKTDLFPTKDNTQDLCVAQLQGAPSDHVIKHILPIEYVFYKIFYIIFYYE